MGIADVGHLSLGEFSAYSRQWAAAHGHGKPQAPTEDEFEAAILAARGVH